MLVTMQRIAEYERGRGQIGRLIIYYKVNMDKELYSALKEKNPAIGQPPQGELNL